MKPSGLLTAIAVLAILGGSIWWSNKHPAAPASSTAAAPKLISVDAKQIDDIRIAKLGSEPIELAKLAGSWEIAKPNAMHADQDAVNMLTGSLATLNADRLIDDHPANLNDFGLATPAMEVDVSVKGGKMRKLLIGSDTPAGTGTYVKLADDPKVYTVPTYTKTSFDKSASDLRDKQLLTFNQDKIVSLALAGKGPAVELSKNAQGDWQITKPKPMRADSIVVDDLARKLRDAKMDLASTDAAEQYAKAEKAGVATITDSSGAQTLDVHKGKDNSYYAKSSVVPGFFKIAGDVGDSFTKGVDDFRNKKVFDFGYSDVSKIEMNGATYVKSGDQWKSGATREEPDSVQVLIDKIRDLTATRLSDKDKLEGTQAYVIGITAGDKHRYEKVTIDKNGDMYEAQRADGPTIYLLDAKAVDDLQKAAAGVMPYQAPKTDKKS